MVSFITISQGVSLCLLVSSMMLGSSAVPVAGHKGSVKATNGTDFQLPPLISSRCTPPSHPETTGDPDAEAYYINKNVQWYQAHGGNYTALVKRDTETVGGMTLDLPENPPPIPAKSTAPSSDSGEVVTATAAQIKELTNYAGVAATAYCRDVVPGTKWNCKQCLKYVPDGKLIKTFTSLLSDTNGFVLRSDAQKTIYVTFRGTNSFRSAITDMVFTFTDYTPVKGAKVHAGFLSSYKQVVSDYFPVVQDQLTAYPGYKVIVTGHSLGGAQALLAGMDLYQREKRLSPKNLSIYTIGCPRVGNNAFAYYVDSTGIPFHRTVHKRDIVPHVPPQAFGYLHPGVESWIKEDPADVQICTSNIETKQCSNSIVPFTSILDHLTYFGINEGSCL
ncbi:lipase [Rhizopus microsporus var. microsporus]|uniref:Lipase n=2 Tax=Rhizopus microsporus TaxID=58291 RepID=A0A2G4T0X6_RHIZD|nr:lipase [Rhizopus microsporus ATCC 52813]ORE11977.1 lipase [Rhizopus microsporus var. microsporus]PHZ14326.1 lipase [Rhizopus microsporus ATCC 52813]